jgi:hypothetical protein
MIQLSFLFVLQFLFCDTVFDALLNPRKGIVDLVWVVYFWTKRTCARLLANFGTLTTSGVSILTSWCFTRVLRPGILVLMRWRQGYFGRKDEFKVCRNPSLDC